MQTSVLQTNCTCRNLKDVRNGVPAEQQRKDVWRVVFQPRAEGRDKGAGLSGGWAGFTKDQVRLGRATSGGWRLLDC